MVQLLPIQMAMLHKEVKTMSTTVPASKNKVIKHNTNNIYDYARYYVKHGLSVIPLKPRSKEPLVAWKQYQERLPSPNELEEWFKGRRANIAVVTGRVSGNLVVLDFDSKDSFKAFVEKLKSASELLRIDINNTWIVETGKGYHVYLRLPREDLVPSTKVRLVEGVDLKAEGGYVVAPPSTHPSGKQYRFIEVDGELLGPPNISEPIELREEEWKELLRLLAPLETTRASRYKRPIKATKKLSEEQINKVIELLKPYYVKDYRNNIVFSLLGVLVKNRVDYESAYKLIDRLTLITNDEERNKRLYLVDYHYGRRAETVGIENLKGVSGLREIIEQQLTARGVDPEEAQDQALMLISQLNEALGISVEQNTITVPIKTGGPIDKRYANDPKRGILILTRRSDYIEREYIFGYYVEKVIVHVNPSDPNDRVYSVVFKHPRTGDTITYSEQSIASIIADIENTKYGVRNPNKLKGAISSIIEAMDIKGLAEKKIRVPATGFFEVDGELAWFESPRFKVKLPEVDRDKTIEALERLEELLAFYRFSDKALAGLYWGIQAPLGLVRKTYGRENKMILHYGEPHVGKTLLNKIIAFLWGMEEDQAIIGASKLTAAQLAVKLNRTTLPLTLDEARNPLVDSNIADMLKNSTTNLHAKSRIDPSMGYRVIEFYAYASVAMTTNYVPQLYVGLEDRIIPVEWTVEDKRSEEEVKSFLEKLAKYKDSLAYIGSYLRDMYVRRWDEVKKIILSDLDQVEIGRRLLELLYEDLEVEKPEWLRRIELRYEIDQPTPEEVFFEVLREDLVEAVRKAGIVLETRDDYGVNKVELVKEDWLTRVTKLAELGFLPSYMVLGKKNVYIKPSVIDHIRRKKGYEIAGGLSNLAKRLGYRYDKKNGVGKSMWIPLTDLVERLNQLVIDEEEA